MYPIVLVGYSKIIYFVNGFAKEVEYLTIYPTVLVDY
jgi:hypothetical protein